MTRNERGDKPMREREPAEENAAMEEDRRRYDDIDPGLNEASRQAFPEGAGGSSSPNRGELIVPERNIPPLSPPPAPDRNRMRASFPGRPVASDFNLRDACDIERQYQPLVLPRAVSATDREKVDHYPVTQPYSTIDKTRPMWLWPGRIPLRKVSLLVGDPSVGKSFLAIDLAARVSAGLPWPDDLPAAPPRPRANVVLFTAEDSPEETVRARLERAGADLDRVFNLVCVGERTRETLKHTTRGFRIPEDIPGLEDVLHNLEPVGLVVIDTLADFWGSGGMQNNAAVRARLAPLVQAADRRGSAILCIAHFNKRAGAKNLYRTMDSLAFTAFARAVWGVVANPDLPAERYFFPIKNNLAAASEALSFQIAEDRLVWGPPVKDADLKKIIAPTGSKREEQRRRRQEVADWLRDELAEGEVPIKEIKKRYNAQISAPWLLEAAAVELSVVKRRDGFGPSGESLWSLPK